MEKIRFDLKQVQGLIIIVLALTIWSCTEVEYELIEINTISCEVEDGIKICYDDEGQPVDTTLVGSGISLLTWNIQDLGGSKNDDEIRLMAEIIRDYDLIAIQEVVGLDPAGAQAVARIVDNLNRMGSSWDFTISDRTNSPSGNIAERYAFIWKDGTVKLVDRPRLLNEVENDVWREPYYGRFEADSKTYDVINFHARKNADNPIPEINTLIQELLSNIGDNNWLLMGDFNISENEDVWNQLYNIGYKPAVRNSPTTLKRSCDGDNYLNYPIDNIYFNSNKHVDSEAQTVDYVRDCSNLDVARMLSDHLPVSMVIE